MRRITLLLLHPASVSGFLLFAKPSIPDVRPFPLNGGGSRLHVLSSPEQDRELSIDHLSPKERRNDGNSNFLEEDEAGNVHIPSQGFSVSDEMDSAQRDRFVTEVIPLKELPGVAQLATKLNVRGSFEPMRYLVSLSPSKNAKGNVDDKEKDSSRVETTKKAFVLVDVPPFSPQLVTRMQAFMGANAKLVAMIITNRDAIHYDDAPAVFSTRRADLDLWQQAFPEMHIAGYRLDVPRDCRAAVTQILDGYGPFALEEETKIDGNSNVTFVETGRPLTYEEWNHDVAQDVLSGKPPPDDDDGGKTNDDEENDKYTPEAIRQREEGRRLLAVYTPGHSFGSVSYIFPEMGVLCSGYAIPVEDNRMEENEGRGNTGPALDCRGYITTNRAGIARQMESAKSLVRTYIDRFNAILPCRGDPLVLGGDVEDRKELLEDILRQYEKIGEIYEQLGIMSDDEDMDL